VFIINGRDNKFFSYIGSTHTFPLVYKGKNRKQQLNNYCLDNADKAGFPANEDNLYLVDPSYKLVKKVNGSGYKGVLLVSLSKPYKDTNSFFSLKRKDRSINKPAIVDHNKNTLLSVAISDTPGSYFTRSLAKNVGLNFRSSENKYYYHLFFDNMEKEYTNFTEGRKILDFIEKFREKILSYDKKHRSIS